MECTVVLYALCVAIFAIPVWLSGYWYGRGVGWKLRAEEDNIFRRPSHDWVVTERKETE